MKNRHGIDVCANCHKPTPMRPMKGVYDVLTCSEECSNDLWAVVEGVSIEEIKTRGRWVECDCINWCEHCKNNP